MLIEFGNISFQSLFIILFMFLQVIDGWYRA